MDYAGPSSRNAESACAPFVNDHGRSAQSAGVLASVARSHAEETFDSSADVVPDWAEAVIGRRHALPGWHDFFVASPSEGTLCACPGPRRALNGSLVPALNRVAARGRSGLWSGSWRGRAPVRSM